MESNVRAQAVTVTPEMAQDILANKRYSKQRRVYKWQVDFLAEEISNKHLIQGTPIHLVELHGKENLVNGQHTLGAIVKSEHPTILTIIQSTVDTQEELDEIYSNWDTGKMRSMQDAFAAYELDTLLGIPKTHVEKIGASIKFIEANFQHPDSTKKIARHDLRHKVLEWGDASKEYFEIIKVVPTDMWYRFVRQSVMSVAMATIRYVENHQIPIDFWTQTALDDGLSKDDPRKTLNRFISMSSIQSGTSSGKMYTPRNVAIVTSRAWNAFYKGKPMERVFAKRKTTTKVEFKLLGTPWE